MRYIATADTDVGISKKVNQDSVLIKQAAYSGGEVLMAIICDGMGGLSKGELASATVVRAFAKWFDEELPFELQNLEMSVIGGKWSYMLKDLNRKLLEYVKSTNGSNMGTTFSGLLLINDEYVFAHVGDTRIYQIKNGVYQMTKDQTFVEREIERGTMTLSEARVDRRRNLLLQCIGASEVVRPQVQVGRAEKGAYMLCSDGFRHEITDEEMFESLNPLNLMNKDAMHSNVRYLIDLVKSRNERDNISVILIKAE